jgi:hypothetical protein
MRSTFVTLISMVLTSSRVDVGRRRLRSTGGEELPAGFRDPELDVLRRATAQVKYRGLRGADGEPGSGGGASEQGDAQAAAATVVADRDISGHDFVGRGQPEEAAVDPARWRKGRAELAFAPGESAVAWAGPAVRPTPAASITPARTTVERFLVTSSSWVVAALGGLR